MIINAAVLAILFHIYVIQLVVCQSTCPPSPPGNSSNPDCGPIGGCKCACNCPSLTYGNGNGNNGGGGSSGSSCPTCPPPVTPPPDGGPTPNTTLSSSCIAQVRLASLSFRDIGSILGAILSTLLANLIIPILSILLFGNNSVEGAVIPLANTLCYILGLVLLLLQKLGLLGALGPNSLLANLLTGITSG